LKGTARESEREREREREKKYLLLISFERSLQKSRIILECSIRIKDANEGRRIKSTKQTTNVLFERKEEIRCHLSFFSADIYVHTYIYTYTYTYICIN